MGLFVAPWLGRQWVISQSPETQGYRDIFLISYWDTFRLKHWQQVTLGQASLEDILRRFPTNVTGHITQSIPRLLIPTLTGDRLLLFLKNHHLAWVPLLVDLGFVVLMILGWIHRVAKEMTVLEWYIVLYIFMILLPGWHTVRNLVPVLPFLVFYLLKGVDFTVASVKRGPETFPMRMRWAETGASLLLCLIVCSNLLSDRLVFASRCSVSRFR